MLELADVVRRYGAEGEGFTLRVPHFTVAPGERVVVIGPSGSGKSTLLDLLALLVPPDAAGRFMLCVGDESHDVAAAWVRTRSALARIRARHIGYVLQTGGLLPYLSVAENIRLSARLLGHPAAGHVGTLAEQFDIGALMRRYPAQLSVGQRQRVAVARALSHRPALVLADEPTAALDTRLAQVVAGALAEASSAAGAALVVVTHDMAVAERIGGRRVACRPDPASPNGALLEG